MIRQYESPYASMKISKTDTMKSAGCVVASRMNAIADALHRYEIKKDEVAQVITKCTNGNGEWDVGNILTNLKPCRVSDMAGHVELEGMPIIFHVRLKRNHSVNVTVDKNAYGEYRYTVYDVGDSKKDAIYEDLTLWDDFPNISYKECYYCTFV